MAMRTPSSHFAANVFRLLVAVPYGKDSALGRAPAAAS